MLGSRLLSIVNSLLVFGRTEDRFRFRSDGARWCTVVRIDVRQALVALASLEEEVSSVNRFEAWRHAQRMAFLCASNLGLVF